ncbi:hypothetical protein DN752_11215 [Echinicola strongylocentroti]|uniref:DUF4382 domain-containing protein n=1 Tax=Echinicola strongylocentroti TaxID=1795355 RepID=A0A2Z4IJE4_9BACT|nr:DUF4382 domain-containing protein [Echinicola strongylocentroti]AWW30648.1 hypothetical protein DN752_11215 [Echinicola strongylocentroti]
MHRLKRSLGLYLPILFLTFSCLDDASNQSHSLVNVYLVDAPGDWDKVYLDIERVELFVESGNSAGTQEWIPLDYLPLSNIVNVSALVNDSKLILGRGELPLGKISQVKLVFGDGQYLVSEDQELSLQFANAEDEAYIHEVNYPLEGGMSYDLVLDIDLSRSIQAGNTNDVFLFDPVIRVFETGSSATIEGKVTPLDAYPYIYAIMGQDTLGTLTDSLGNFTFIGLEAGEYTVSFEPRAPYLDSLTTVITKLDSTSQMETVLLQEQEIPSE